MSFLQPLFLLALAAVLIPVIIHLFHFRRYKKVYFSNINFLERLSDETQKQARLKHLLVLLMRILAIAFLVMAFARPYIPQKDQSDAGMGNLVSIYIDNSFSMEAGSTMGNLLDQAKQKASEIASLFSPTDRFMLLTNDFEARHQRFLNFEEFTALLAEVEFSPQVRSISEVMARQTLLLKEELSESRPFAFLISDFQKNTSDFQNIMPDTLLEYFLVPAIPPTQTNLFIDSLWIDNPVKMSGQVATVQARIYNDSEQRLENQPIRLFINDSQRAVATFDIAPSSHTMVALTYTLSDETIQKGFAELSDYPVTFDDRFYFSYNLSENIPVMAINQAAPNRFLNALFKSDTTFTVTNVNAGAIDFSLINKQSLIILNELNAPATGLITNLKQFVEQGGSLLIFPPQSMSPGAYNELFTTLEVPGYTRRIENAGRVSAINELHEIYSGVFDRIPENIDLPRAEQYYQIAKPTRNTSQYLLQLQNGDYFLAASHSGAGHVYVSAVPANDAFSNFPRHAIFVPTLYNIALHSTPVFPLSYTITSEEIIPVRNFEPSPGYLFKITAPSTEIIPEVRNINNTVSLVLHDQIQGDGNYNLIAEDEFLRSLSFNFDRRESLLETFSADDIELLASQQGAENMFVFSSENISFQKQVELLQGGRQLWKLFILTALIFLLGEVLLLRLWK